MPTKKPFKYGVKQIRKGMKVPLKELRLRDLSHWQNKKKYGAKHVCTGHYLYQRGKRRFVLANGELGVEHMFDSHEAAKAWGWVKLD